MALDSGSGTAATDTPKQPSEYNSNSQQLPDGSDQRFVGAATVKVSNVTPHGPPFDPNRGVTFVVDLAWSEPLNICTDVVLLGNTPDAVVYVGPGIESRLTGTQVSGRPTALAAPILQASLEATVKTAPARVGSPSVAAPNQSTQLTTTRR